MSFQRSILKRTALSIAIAALMGASVVDAATVTYTNWKKFTIWDLVADFEGKTFGNFGNGKYGMMLCSDDGTWKATCDADHPPIVGDEAVKLYPIDSAFGFHVVPYALATPKEIRDGIWGEGYAGPIMDGTDVIGVELSDAATDTFKTPAGWGTWCAGLGGNTVKCETEHYVVMEHVLTCHETVAYVPTLDGSRADPYDGDQAILYWNDDGNIGSLDCATTKLDNDPFLISSGDPWDQMLLSDAVAAGVITSPSEVLTYLRPNEATVLDDIGVTNDYTMSAKDDGKAKYRWGTIIKKPNDIRLYKRMPLPAAWKTGGACVTQNGGLGCRVTRAELRVNHNITNNPNDQIRPEDMENEGAFGRKPRFEIDPTFGPDSRVSTLDCYEGDGDFIPAGIVLRNTDMALGGVDAIVGTDPYAWSSDLAGGYSNGWYTTVDREPFEWAYDNNGDGSVDASSRAPDDTLGELISGPRWRLTPGKYGQDLPGLDISNVYCAPPPYQKDLIKYPVGAPTQTVITLLDWNSTDERSVIDPDSGLPVSPMTFSNGWVDNGVTNGGTVINPAVVLKNPDLTGVTINGAPVSEDFDLTVYVKGDRKPMQLYSAYLIIEYDDGNP